MTEDPIEITYALTPAMRRKSISMVSQDVASPRGVTRGIAVPLAGGLLLAVAVGMLSYYLLPERNPGVSVLFFGGGFWVCLGLWQRTYNMQVRRVADEFGDGDEQIRLRADTDGVAIDTGQGQSRLNWAAIRGVKQHGGLILLRMSGMALPVPVDALPDGMSAEQMVATLTRWRGPA